MRRQNPANRMKYLFKHKTFLVATFLMVMLISIQACKYQHGSNIRHEDFPEDIFPPDNAFDILYASPKTDRIAKGCYSMSYYVNEEYPAKATIGRIRDDMQSKGCVKVKWAAKDFSIYRLEKVDSKETYVEQIEESKQMREELKDEPPKETEWEINKRHSRQKTHVLHTWNEEWISPNDNLIDIALQYFYPKEKIEMKVLYVTQGVCTSSSWRYPYLKNYKKLHPKEFDPNIFEP